MALEAAGARGCARSINLPWADPDLWTAILEDNLPGARAAIDTGADVNATEPVSGASPLLLATLHGRGEIASLLASRGARTDAPAADGSTPLMAAAFLGRVDMVRLLLRLGADPSRRGTDGKTALDHAAAPWTRDAEVNCQKVMRAAGVEIDIEQVQAGRVNCAAVLAPKKP
jgi:ankyrin repeat protein